MLLRQGHTVFGDGEDMHYNPIDREKDNSIVLYARDYREFGRWVPPDAAMYVGRYMYEADSVPKAWVRHMNLLDEIWVPSEWQKGAFVSAGVLESKIQVRNSWTLLRENETVHHVIFIPRFFRRPSTPITSILLWWNL